LERSDRRQAPDEELVEAARQGDLRALEGLLDRHESTVLRVLGFLGVRAQDREDVAQEIFIRVFRHLGTFRRGRPFGGWLYRVTVNAAHDHRRVRERAGREEEPWGAEADRVAAEGPAPPDPVERREVRRALVRAMDRLSERERAVFVLREIEGLETAEVARVLGITSITVRRHLSRARSSLRAQLGGGVDGAPLGVERIAPGGSRRS